MRLICAWCRKDLSDEKNSPEETPEEISYGICPECRVHFFPGSKESRQRKKVGG